MAHYDLLVIGTGPAGQKAAVQAAKLGKKVGIVERKEMLGGVCINEWLIEHGWLVLEETPTTPTPLERCSSRFSARRRDSNRSLKASPSPSS